MAHKYQTVTNEAQKTAAFWDVCQKCWLKVRCCGDHW